MAYLTGWLLGLFYVVMGEETYQVRLDVQLHPVRNPSDELIDVDIRFESSLTLVRVPHEVVYKDKIVKVPSGHRLFQDEEGSFSLTLDLKLENFTRTVFTRTESIEIPLNYTFIVYCRLDDAEAHTVMQLTVEGEKHLTLTTLRNPIAEKVSYLEKFEV